MPKTDYKSVDEYIATHPPKVRAILRRVRRIIQKAVPGAEEAISYQIPTFKRDGTAVVYLAGWKEHYSLYPVSAQLLASVGDDLDAYEQSKGTIRFPLSGPVPTHLISRIAKLLAQEAEVRAKARRAKAGKAKAGKAKAGKAKAGKAKAGKAKAGKSKAGKSKAGKPKVKR